jgi:hypothetical protein
LAVIRRRHGGVDALDGLAVDEQQVQFGVMLNGEVDALIAKTAAAAHFCVTLTWKAQPVHEGV